MPASLAGSATWKPLLVILTDNQLSRGTPVLSRVLVQRMGTGGRLAHVSQSVSTQNTSALILFCIAYSIAARSQYCREILPPRSSCVARRVADACRTARKNAVLNAPANVYGLDPR